MSRQAVKCRPPPGNPFYASIYRAYEDGIQPSTEDSSAFEEAVKKKRLQLAARAEVEPSRRWMREIEEEYLPEDCLVVSSGLKLRSPVPPPPQRPAPRLTQTPASTHSPTRCAPPSDLWCAPVTAVSSPRKPGSPAATKADIASPLSPNGFQRPVPPRRLDSQGAADHAAKPTSPPPAGMPGPGGSHWPPSSPPPRPSFEETIQSIAQRLLPGDGSDLFGLGCCLRRQFCWRFYLAEAPLDGSWQRFAELALVAVDHSELSVVDAFATRYVCPAPEVVLYHWQHLWQTGRRDLCRYPPTQDSVRDILGRLGRLDLIELLSAGQ